MYSLPHIADALEAGLAAEAARLDQEQAVAGLDALDELRLHPLIGRALENAGYGVFSEQRYPTDRRKRNQTEGDRCDLVLTPDGRELTAPEVEPTLFDPPDALPLPDAFWLEVKVVGQYVSGGPNHNYGSQLLSTVSQDVLKLSRDPAVVHGGLLILLFTEDQRVADHDLEAWLSHCLELRLPVGSPCLRRLPITDRLGNAVCSIGLFPVTRG